MPYTVVFQSGPGVFAWSREAEEWIEKKYKVERVETLARHDPRLCEVVEELGEIASRINSNIQVKELFGNRYLIVTEQDGSEHVIEPDPGQAMEDDRHPWITIENGS